MFVFVITKAIFDTIVHEWKQVLNECKELVCREKPLK